MNRFKVQSVFTPVRITVLFIGAVINLFANWSIIASITNQLPVQIGISAVVVALMIFVERIANTAFVDYQNSRIRHFSCSKNLKDMASLTIAVVAFSILILTTVLHLGQTQSYLQHSIVSTDVSNSHVMSAYAVDKADNDKANASYESDKAKYDEDVRDIKSRAEGEKDSSCNYPSGYATKTAQCRENIGARARAEIEELIAPIKPEEMSQTTSEVTNSVVSQATANTDETILGVMVALTIIFIIANFVGTLYEPMKDGAKIILALRENPAIKNEFARELDRKREVETKVLEENHKVGMQNYTNLELIKLKAQETAGGLNYIANAKKVKTKLEKLMIEAKKINLDVSGIGAVPNPVMAVAHKKAFLDIGAFYKQPTPTQIEQKEIIKDDDKNVEDVIEVEEEIETKEESTQEESYGMVQMIKDKWDMGSIKKGDRLLSKSSIKMASNSVNNSAHAVMCQALIDKGYITRKAGNIDYANEELYRILADKSLMEKLR